MNEIFAFLNIGNTELIIILVIILLLFGAKKLPELARGLGKSMQEFKKATREVEDNFRDAINEEESSRKPAEKVEAKAEKEEQK
ncbi:MAG: twin-arginine translocase TatA/TatE family subunit [Opitutales bacterium]|nr:twin-arginine translocase TatA/TatE family subunit [Opitutales bacterium]